MPIDPKGQKCPTDPIVNGHQRHAHGHWRDRGNLRQRRAERGRTEWRQRLNGLLALYRPPVYRITLALVLISLAAPAVGQDLTGPDLNRYLIDRFQLWTRCAPVYLIVEDLSENAAEIGLTKESIETLIRSRLRAARIYIDGFGEPQLYLIALVAPEAFTISLRFVKWLSDPTYSGDASRAVVWQIGGVGTHSGRGAGYIRQSISRHMDEFIDEYLRVNAEACGGPDSSRQN